MADDAFERYRRTYNYADLIKNHSLDAVGQWQVFGEDPNCDFGGHHHTPLLEIVSGRLSDVIEYAVTLPGFWAGGGGGHIEPYTAPAIRNVDETTAKRRVDLREEIDRLKAQLVRLQKNLEDT